jgi:DNA-binding NarL/FixJ family response regulator
MTKDVRVLIVEDDLYSRDMMTMLLTRDWRTRVVGELCGQDDVSDFFSQPIKQVDVILIGIETTSDQEWPFLVLDMVCQLDEPPIILYAATRVEGDIFNYIHREGFGGYLLKEEILYSLASAVVLAEGGYCVITPGVKTITSSQEWPLQTLVVDGSKKVADFSKRESEIVHLGVLFNMSQRDIADELVIGTDWVSETMSNVYAKLGLHEILHGEIALDNFLDDETVLDHYEKIIDRATRNIKSGGLRKAPWMSTLAFHLLTVPVIEEL